MKTFLRSALTVALLFCGAATNAQDLPEYSAKFISQTGVTNAMGSGQTYQVSARFQNTGKKAWTSADQIGLANVSGKWTFGDTFVRVAPGETVEPQAYKTFTWSFRVSDCVDGCPNGDYSQRVNSVPRQGQIPTAPFQWQMLRPGYSYFGELTPKVDVEIFWVPVTRTTINNFAAYLAAKPPVPLSDSTALSFQNFRGADVVGGLNQMPTVPEMEVLARRMVDMNLNVVRLLVNIPHANDRTHDWNAEMNQIQAVFDVADRYGIKVMPSLGGYMKYMGTDIEANLGPVAENCSFYGSFESRKVNAGLLVDRLKNHHALFAWLLHSEPIWTMYSGAPEAPPKGCPDKTLADYQSVVNAVHAMYMVVRDRDSVHPTSVADSPNPFMGIWKPISSFASTHLYFFPNRIGGIGQLQSYMDASILQTQNKVAPLKLIVGETGFELDKTVFTRKEQADAYREIFASFERNNVGSAFWELSSWADQAPWSLLTTASTKDSLGNPVGPWGELIREPTDVIKSAISAVRNSAVASYSVPSVMQAGQRYTVSVSFKNTGNIAWSKPADFQLGSRLTDDNAIWGSSRQTYGSSDRATMPGETKTFTFTVTAPLQRASYNFSWGMIQQAVERFGPALTVPVTVQ